MSDYSQSTFFTPKDSLTTGDPLKIIKGVDFDGEFSAISTAIATKYDSDDLASQAEAEAASSNTVLMTPGRVNDWAADNAGAVEDIQALADPGADRIMFWDDSDGAIEWLTAGTGVAISGNTLSTTDSEIVHDNLSGFVANEHINHGSVSVSAGNGLTGGGTIAANRTLTLGTPGTTTPSTSNAVTASSHTHALDDGVLAHASLGSGVVNVQNGGSPSGGSNGDITLIY